MHVTGFVMLMLVTFTGSWAGSVVTVAHEGGHMILAILTGRGLKGFGLEDGGGGGTDVDDQSWGPGLILLTFAGYVTPPLAGLAGSSLVLAGRSWSVLWVAVILLLGAWAQFKNLLAAVVILVAGGGIGWVAVEGAPELRTGLAVALVWWMLLGGVRAAAILSRDDGTDPARLASYTLVPRIVWHGVFLFVAIICLWVGGRRLLGV